MIRTILLKAKSGLTVSVLANPQKSSNVELLLK